MRSMKTRKIVLLATAAYLAKKELNKRRHSKKARKWWVRPIFQKRDQLGFYETTFQTMKQEDHEMFSKATRMSVENFNALFNLLQTRLEKYSPRKPIPAECRLALTLIYLAHGGPRYIYAWKFKMSTSVIGNIIRETCEAIWEELNGIYLSPPNKNEWIEIAKAYENKWHLPHCLGAIDGKHVTIVCPPNAGSQFFNYKRRHSIVLLAVCDANYCFTMVDIGAYGSQSDGGILSESTFGKLLVQNKLPIPQSSFLPMWNEMFPYFFVGDSAFPQSRNLMRPFPEHNVEEEDNFNKRLSHARVTIENTFGVLASRWRVLRNDIHPFPNTVDNIIKATVLLHNYLMLQRCNSYWS